MSGLQQAAAVLGAVDKAVAEALPDSSAQGVVKELTLQKLSLSSDEAAVKAAVEEVLASDTMKPLLAQVPSLRFRRVGL